MRQVNAIAVVVVVKVAFDNNLLLVILSKMEIKSHSAYMPNSVHQCRGYVYAVRTTYMVYATGMDRPPISLVFFFNALIIFWEMLSTFAATTADIASCTLHHLLIFSSLCVPFRLYVRKLHHIYI